MAQTARILKSALTWFFILLGLCLGVLGLAGLGFTPVFGYGFRLSQMPRIGGFVFLGFTPLIASLLALRSRKRAALTYFSAVPGILLCFGLQGGPTLVAGRVVSGILIALGLFWLVTHRLRWPEVDLARGRSALQKVAMTLVACLLLLTLVSIASISLKLRYGYWDDDCGEAAPFARPRYEQQAVFVARVVHAGPILGGVGLVQQTFWGLPWWNRRVVLLPFGRTGEVYFVDGRRADGLLTHFLPVIDFHCGRTRLLSDAAVDLRVLHDGPPRNGVRIIGKAIRWDAADSRYKPVPGLEVVITGTTRTFTAIADQQGIYDIGGLPPGKYSVSAGPASGTGGQGYYCYGNPRELNAGDIGGCTLRAR